MPIIEVEIVGPIASDLRIGLAQRLADVAGVALNALPQTTWVKVRFVADDAYAENDGDAADAEHPVFVSLLQAERPRDTHLAEQALRVAAAIAKACGRSSERVHIVFEPAATGRIAFGGKLVM